MYTGTSRGGATSMATMGMLIVLFDMLWTVTGLAIAFFITYCKTLNFCVPSANS